MNTTDRTRPAGPDTIEAAPLRGLSESDRTLLIVDDDAPLCQRLARAMERRGFVVSTAESVAAGTTAATAQAPAFAVVALRLGDGSGLDVVSAVRTARPGAQAASASLAWRPAALLVPAMIQRPACRASTGAPLVPWVAAQSCVKKAPPSGDLTAAITWQSVSATSNCDRSWL